MAAVSKRNARCNMRHDQPIAERKAAEELGSSLNFAISRGELCLVARLSECAPED